MEQSSISSASITNGHKQRNEKCLKVAMVVVSIVAVCGIGFGIYGMAQSSQKDSRISELEVGTKGNDENDSMDKDSEADIRTVEETNSGVTDSSNLSEDELSHYIYVAQWGVKIALPPSLKSVSYEYADAPGYTYLGVTGVSCAEQGQCQYKPEFADPLKTGYYLGGVVRAHKDSSVPANRGEKIVSIGDYDYYYSSAQAVYSTDENEQKWELESHNLIKSALIDTKNYSNI